MNVIANTWRQLVRRRLWPVALLLVAALAAVPVLLSREAAPVPPPVVAAPVAAAEAGDEIAEPVVAMASAEDRGRRRRVLGARKDPFEPAVVCCKEVEEKPAPEPPAEEERAPDPGSSGGSAPAPAPEPVAPVNPAPAPVEPPAEPKKTYELNSLIVRFGDSEAGRERTNLERLKPLPSAEEPVLVYLGLDKQRKHAIFMVDASLEPTGDGICKPRPETCETIHLAEGDTHFFDLVDPETGEITAQYQLDLIDIKSRRTTSKEKAEKAYAGEAKGGRKALRARVAGSGPLRWDYDRGTGTLQRRGAKAYKAAVARIAASTQPQD